MSKGFMSAIKNMPFSLSAESNKSLILVSVYGDDLLPTGNCLKEFDMADSEKNKFFKGLRYNRLKILSSLARRNSPKKWSLGLAWEGVTT